MKRVLIWLGCGLVVIGISALAAYLFVSPEMPYLSNGVLVFVIGLLVFLFGMIPDEIQKDAPKKYVWRRFFARSVVDLMLFVFIPMWILDATIAFPSPDSKIGPRIYVVLLGFLLLLLWIPIEALFLRVTSTTPGKWLMGIHVKAANGDNLSFGRAIRRTFLVTLEGVCFYIPIVSLVTGVLAYRRLIRTGTTRWDQATGAIVVKEKLGQLRRGLGVMLVTLFLFYEFSMATLIVSAIYFYLM